MALDALTLVGEILTVLVVDADVFDHLAYDLVDRNDEGQVVAGHAATAAAVMTGRIDPSTLRTRDFVMPYRRPGQPSPSPAALPPRNLAAQKNNLRPCLIDDC